MYSKPGELRLHPLNAIKPGTLIQLAGRTDDIPRAIKLPDTEGGQPRIFILGGDYSYEDAIWKDGVQLATIICEADKLLVGLGSIDEQMPHTTPGCILVYEGGAVINAQRERRFRIPIDLATWDRADGEKPRSPSVLYSTWALGYLDAKSDFITIFSKE